MWCKVRKRGAACLQELKLAAEVKELKKRLAVYEPGGDVRANPTRDTMVVTEKKKRHKQRSSTWRRRSNALRKADMGRRERRTPRTQSVGRATVGTDEES